MDQKNVGKLRNPLYFLRWMYDYGESGQLFCSQKAERGAEYC